MTDLRSAVAAHGGLCAISDLAARWDTSKQWVRVLARRSSFPAPILTEGGRELWPADEADAWFVAHEARVIERGRS